MKNDYDDNVDDCSTNEDNLSDSPDIFSSSDSSYSGQQLSPTTLSDAVFALYQKNNK